MKDKLIAFAKNRQTWGFLLSVVIMAIISLAYFYPDNFEGRDLSQHDMVQGLANGHEITEYEAATGEQSRWTNSLFGGMPTFQISPSYPSDSLFRWFNTVYGLGLPSPSNLLFMMMLGMMILMISMRYRWEYGLIAAVAWGFSTYFIIIIGAGHIWKFVTLAYIPPTIGGILLAYRGKYLAGGAMAAFFAMMQLMSNHIQMTYYFLFVVVGLSIAYLVTAIKEKRAKDWLKATGVLAVAAALAVCANLPNIYHTYKYAKESQRAGSELAASDDNKGSEGLSRDYITQYSYGKAETLTLLIPDVKGGASAKPYQGSMKRMTLAELDAAEDYSNDQATAMYMQQAQQYFGEPEGTNGPVYVGALIFALFVLGCVIVKGPLKWALLALTVLSIFLAWGRNFMSLTDLFLDIVPMYSQFRTPESILVIAEFTMPLLAVMALWQLVKEKSHYALHLTPVLVAFGAVALVCLVIALFPSVAGPTMDNDAAFSEQFVNAYVQQGYSAEEVSMFTVKNPAIYAAVENIHHSVISSDAWRSMSFVAIGFALVMLILKGALKPAVAVPVIGLVVLVDLYTVNKRYLDHDSFDPVKTVDVKSLNPSPADAAILQDKDMNYRVADFDHFMEASPSYFHKAVGGYHAAKLRRYDDLISTGMIQSENVLNMLNTKYIIYQGQVIQNPDALGNAWFVEKVEYVDTPMAELQAVDALTPAKEAVADKAFSQMLGTAAADSTATIAETSYAPDKLTYKSSSKTDGVAVFSEVYFPWGWKAEIDGKPAEIGRVNYVLRALRIPAGEHEITMTFDPQSVKTTSTIAYIAIILIYLSIILAVAKRLRG